MRISIESLKKDAKRLNKSTGKPLNECQNIVAKDRGFHNFRHFQNEQNKVLAGTARRLKNSSILEKYPEISPQDAHLNDIANKSFLADKSLSEKYEKLRPFLEVEDPKKLTEADSKFRQVMSGVLRRTDSGSVILTQYYEAYPIPLTSEERHIIRSNWSRKGFIF